MTNLKTIDGETLMSQPLQPLNFVVDTLISQGLHILAGSPKVGKSWLALWLAVTVAKGEPVWGMRVKRGTTLYLCLEDSQLRIQNRLFEVTEDAPPNVHFCTESRILGNGLTEQLEQFLGEHPDTTLVIIDTLQMIRGTNYDNTYANDYRDLSVLKRLADAHGIAVLLIHHLRKEKADDVFNRISGTTAISGAVDSSFTLVGEQRGSGRAKLLRCYCYYKMYEAQEGGFEMSDYVFTNKYGELMHPDTFSRHLRRLYDENGFPREFHLHTLRHYFVSTMLHNGVDKQTVAELAGHGDTGFLERTYCHPQLQLKREAASRYTRTMFDFSDRDSVSA